MLDITPFNYEPSRGFCWHRKLTSHPDITVARFADAFCEYISSTLGIPVPTILWFEEASAIEAASEWNENARRLFRDPYLQPSEFFWWPGRKDKYFKGFTPRVEDGPASRIMINCSLRDAELCGTIAHECFHVKQDHANGHGWRTSSDQAVVEGGATKFEEGCHPGIADFLTRWQGVQ